MNKEISFSKPKLIIRKCHQCSQIVEAHKEQDKCLHCGKSFLPLKYFDKIHNHKGNFKDLFAEGFELAEEDLVKGIYVLW